MIISYEEVCLIKNLKRMLLPQKTLQIFVLLSDISKIPDVRTLSSLKKGLSWESIYEKGHNRVAIFFKVAGAHHLHFPSYTTVESTNVKFY